ncbi:sugar ABC transporter substrate-binding protein [bacterium]|nr:sugar ABC transporter substrate-binding protein [bacterium]
MTRNVTSGLDVGPTRRAFALLIIALALLANACSGQDGKAELRVVFWAGTEEERVEQANVDAFMEAHPGVKVSLESIPGNYLEKLVTAFAARKPPDVLLLDSVLIPRFLKGGVLLDLQPYLDQDPDFDPDAFFAEVYDIARRGEAVYALPKDFTPLVVYYNKRLFDEAGIAYPASDWTWEEFRETARALTADIDGDGRTDRYGTLVYTWPAFNIVWFWQAGGDVLSPDGSRASGYLDSPESIKAVEFFTGLVEEGLAPDPAAREALGGGAFMSGRVGMTISGHWSIPGFRVAAERDSKAMGLGDIGVCGLPRGAKRVSVIYESGWAVAKQTARPELAVELVKYLAGPEAQRRRATIGLAISSDRSVAAEIAQGDPFFYPAQPRGLRRSYRLLLANGLPGA